MKDHTQNAMMESLETRECFSADLMPYGGFNGGIRVASGDVNNNYNPFITVDVWEHAAVGGRVGGIAVDPSDPSTAGKHPGGANFAFCDGSVRFVKSTTALDTAGFGGGVRVAVGDVNGDGASNVMGGQKLQPLISNSGNTDFDGDQMAVHLPLSVEAQTFQGKFGVSMIYTF